jgi:hypothetical protein
MGARFRGPTLWIGVGLALLATVLLYRQVDLGRLLTLDNLKASRDALVGAWLARPVAPRPQYTR